MKKTVGIAVLAVLAGAGVMYAVRSFAAQSAAAQTEVSLQAAREVLLKVALIKTAHNTPDRRVSERVEVTEGDLRSYVVLLLKDDIPARIDSFEIQLTDGAVAADTKMTFSATPTTNPLIDGLISGTHRLSVKGNLSATGGMGKFTLTEARVDGIPVPTVLIETLIDKYVKPRNPYVRLDQPFAMPWGIEDLTVTSGKATIVY